MKRKLLFLPFIFSCLFTWCFAQNVGVGTSTPQAKLDVAGDFRLLNGVNVHTISADSNFAPGSDNILPTQKAIKRYIQKGGWLPQNSFNASPFLLDNVSASIPSSVYVQGNYAYVASSNVNRLSIFDISDPNNMVAKGFTTTNLLSPRNVFVQGNYAYVASANNGRLCIFDISDPTTIVAKGFISTNLTVPVAVFVQGNYAYVTSQSNNSLCIFDISDPNTIVAKGFTTTNLSAPSWVHIQGNYAYVASKTNQRLCIFSINNPNTIVARGFTNTNLLGPVAVFIQGNYAYVASQSNKRLCIYDVADPDAIIARGFTSASLDAPYSVFVKGNYAFMASDMNNSLCMFDISDPDNIVLRSANTEGLSLPLAAFVQGNYVYVASRGNDKLCSFYYSETGAITIGSTGGFSVNSPAWETDGTNIFRGGNVGIGTTNPAVPLDIAVYGTVTSGNYGYLNSSGMAGFSGGGSVSASVRATGTILASFFAANSDQRIKRNIRNSDSRNDLHNLLQLRVADYQLKDSIYNGNITIKGFIAQELETIMPGAVRNSTDYVPDVYCLSTSTEYNEKDKTLKVSLCKPHNLKIGDKVKVFAGDGIQEQYVSAINNETTFTLYNWEIRQAGMNPVAKVFVWGKQVNDFHTVDYNQVFSLGISAMQQLAKENDELKAKTESLQLQIDELKKMILGKQ